MTKNTMQSELKGKLVGFHDYDGRNYYCLITSVFTDGTVDVCIWKDARLFLVENVTFGTSMGQYEVLTDEEIAKALSRHNELFGVSTGSKNPNIDTTAEDQEQ